MVESVFFSLDHHHHIFVNLKANGPIQGLAGICLADLRFEFDQTMGCSDDGMSQHMPTVSRIHRRKESFQY